MKFDIFDIKVHLSAVYFTLTKTAAAVKNKYTDCKK